MKQDVVHGQDLWLLVRLHGIQILLLEVSFRRSETQKLFQKKSENASMKHSCKLLKKTNSILEYELWITII